MNSNSQRYISGAEWETLTGLHPVELARACVILGIAAYDPDTFDISDVPEVMTVSWCVENAEKIFENSPLEGWAVLGQDGGKTLQILQETNRLLQPAFREALDPVAEHRSLITKYFRTLLFAREDIEKLGGGNEVEEAIIARGLEKLQTVGALDFLNEFNMAPPQILCPVDDTPPLQAKGTHNDEEQGTESKQLLAQVKECERQKILLDLALGHVRERGERITNDELLEFLCRNSQEEVSVRAMKEVWKKLPLDARKGSGRPKKKA